MRLLILRLEGPLQSWGERSKWDNRDSALMPTKSGVIGIIACCMGVPRDDERMLELHQKLRIAVRADMPGRLGVDYHTVSAECLLTAEGKPRKKEKGKDESTIISKRQYLQDASFLAVVSSTDEDLLDSVEYSLRHPKWVAYLGRKSCVPTYPLIPVVTDEFDSMEQAINDLPFAERTEPERLSFRAEIEDPAGIYTRGDSLVSVDRHFSIRRVNYHTVRRREDVSLQIDA